MSTRRHLAPVVLFVTASLLGGCGGGSGEVATTASASDLPAVSAEYCDLVRSMAQKVRDDTAGEAEIADVISRLADIAPPELEADYQALLDAASQTGQVEPGEAATVQVAADRIQQVNNARCPA